MNLDKLESDVIFSRRLIISILVILPLSYFGWFFLVNGHSLSTDSSSWAEFGDFVGGILNPLIAIFAVYWLTHSILIQKQELSETRTALEKSQLAQTRQAELALVAARIQSLNMRMTIISSELAAVLAQRNIILSASQDHYFRNEKGDLEPREDLLANFNARIQAFRTSQTELIRDIEALLAET